MRIEDRLYLVKFNPDRESHLEIVSRDVCRACEMKPCLYFCPANVYEWNEENQIITVAFEGCFECGACRIGCPPLNIAWRYPRGGCGVAFRFG